MKIFNTTGLCNPQIHYMVDLTSRIYQIRKMVDAGDYFTINRARQYGKTTILTQLEKNLEPDYVVVSMDFQNFGSESFSTEGVFCRDFATNLCELLVEKSELVGTECRQVLEELHGRAANEEKSFRFFSLSGYIKQINISCARPVILMIDEVDSASNNQVFLDFLAQLRALYLKRAKSEKEETFHSVILAGVTDVKHLKRRIRDDEQHKVNSPWNIAADFTIDMSFSADEITHMLDEYEADHQTGMQTAELGKSIYDYTSGYPFLVSRICQLMDIEYGQIHQKKCDTWSKEGFMRTIRKLLTESNTLFESLTGKLENDSQLYEILRSLLMEGKQIPYNPDQYELAQMQMYGFIRNDSGLAKLSNRIFETRLYNLFLTNEELGNNAFSEEGAIGKSNFIKDQKLDMPLILERFRQTYEQIFGPLTDRFHERDGRELFLLFLKPIINGTGNYYIEAQTRSQTRTDVIIDYLGCQYVVELKIWRGERYHQAGEKQLKEYLDYFQLDTGYMLSFNFNQKKQTGLQRIVFGDKVLFEEMI